MFVLFEAWIFLMDSRWKLYLWKILRIPSFFWYHGVFILHLNVVTLQLIKSRFQRVNTTIVEQTNAYILSCSFGKVPKILSEWFFKLFCSLVHPGNEVLVDLFFPLTSFSYGSFPLAKEAIVNFSFFRCRKSSNVYQKTLLFLEDTSV